MEKANEIAWKRTRKEIKDGIQTIQYQINTLMTTNDQAPVGAWSSVCRAYAGRRPGRSPRSPCGVVSAAGSERRESIRIRRLPVRLSQGRRVPNLAGAGKMDVLRRGMRRHGPLRYSGDYMMMGRTMGSGTLPVVKWK